MADGIDKLTISFNTRPTFREKNKEIDLAKSTDTLKVIGKNGQEKTIEGFMSSSGTFFQLKAYENGTYKIRAYGSPEQLAKANLKVRSGDLTKARFGDQRLYQQGAFHAHDFKINDVPLSDPEAFAAHFRLTRKPGEGVDEPLLDAGGDQQPIVDAGDGEDPPPVEIKQKGDEELLEGIEEPDPADNPRPHQELSGAFVGGDHGLEDQARLSGASIDDDQPEVIEEPSGDGEPASAIARAARRDEPAQPGSVPANDAKPAE